MNNNVCPQCGAQIDPGAFECKFCGEKIAGAQANQNLNGQNQFAQQPYGQQPYGQQQSGQQPYVQQPYVQNVYVQNPVNPGVNPAWPVKNKMVAGILAILLGGLGIHKFYLGKTFQGVMCILFCWTYIPAIIGFVEGIIYLCSSDVNFSLKHHVRLSA